MKAIKGWGLFLLKVQDWVLQILYLLFLGHYLKIQ